MRRKILFAAVLAASLTGFAGMTRADNAGPRVLVIPFKTLNMSDDMQWVAKAVQEDVVSDLGRAGGYTPVTTDAQVVVEDNAAAVRIGKQANAAFVVRGAVQQVDQTVRLTGQFIDVGTGDTLNSASVTGPVGQLLRLEDELAKQLRGASPVVDAQTAPAQPMTPSSALAPTPAATDTQVVYVPVPTDVSYPPGGYYNTPYAYDYGDYGSYYPGFYSSPIVFFTSGFGFHRHHDDFRDGGRDRSRFTFGRFGGSTVGGFNQFHSPRSFNSGPLVTQPVFANTRPVFNSQPVFNRVGFNTGFGNSFGRSGINTGFSRGSFGGGISGGGGFGGHSMGGGGGWGGHR